MDTKKQKWALFILSVILVIAGVQFAIFCPVNDSVCATKYDAVALPLTSLATSVWTVALLLFFVREETYKSWRRFAYWAIPISIFLLWIAPISGPTGIGISFLNYTKESASWLVSGVFLLVSLWIIVRKTLRS